MSQYIETVEWKIDADELESLLFTVGHAAEKDWQQILSVDDYEARKKMTLASGKQLRAEKSQRLQEAKKLADQERMLDAMLKKNEEAIKIGDDADDEQTAKMKKDIASHFELSRGYEPRAPQIEAIVRMEAMIRDLTR